MLTSNVTTHESVELETFSQLHPNSIWARFRKFVAEQPKDDIIDGDDTHNCPIAQFAKATFGKKRFCVAKYSYFLTKDSIRVYIVEGDENRHRLQKALVESSTWRELAKALWVINLRITKLERRISKRGVSD